MRPVVDFVNWLKTLLFTYDPCVARSLAEATALNMLQNKDKGGQ